jgi:hypothetical protein
MAVVTNILLRGLKGRLGTQVFRTQNGKTVVSAAPKRKAAYTEAQKQQQYRFKQATTNARKLLEDLETKA